MNIVDLLEVFKKYELCPECGHDTDEGRGTFKLNGEIYSRTCECGWSITVDKRIKVVACAKKRVGRKSEGVYEVIIDNIYQHKYLPMNDLKALAGAKRADNFKRIQEWLNTEEGRKWAIDTPHVVDF